jgi:large subunit ribosomal protein L25
MSKVSNAISVMPRTDYGKGASRRARRDGKIPAVVYSRGVESRGFLVSAKEWESLTRHEVGLLTLKDGSKEIAVLIKEVQANTLKACIVHIDFIEVKMDVEITAMIQIHHAGEDPIGLSQGGVLEQAVHEIEVKCLPNNLPEGLEPDISAVELNGVFLAKEIILPEGVVYEGDPELTIFKVNQPAAEVEETEEAAEGEEGEDGSEDAAASEGGE